jgi:hypothetical protein
MDAGDSLADIATAVRFLAKSGDPAATRIAAALDRWRRSRTMTFEQALGAVPGVRYVAAQRARDEAIRALAERVEAEMPDREMRSCRARSKKTAGWAVAKSKGHSRRAVAKETHKQLRSYRLTRWQLDRRDGRRPDGLQGLCHDILQRCLDYSHHPGVEQIRNIIDIP